MIAVASFYKNACLSELEAVKPGNVHVLADGHGMTVEHFIKSAEASTSVIALPDLSLGQRIFQAVEATHQAVGCNTNLGIVLLCAPLVHAALISTDRDVMTALEAVLANTTVQDAQACFDAIRLANPAGLGGRQSDDVRQPAKCTLLEAMQQVAIHDSVARQYANRYADILDGLVCLKSFEARWERVGWATTGVYLHFLSTFADSHIARKHGIACAEMIQSEAKIHFANLSALDNPKPYLGKLLAWDADLKARGINPGTSADLTVATLFLSSLI